jgi:hypothetical protein
MITRFSGTEDTSMSTTPQTMFNITPKMRADFGELAKLAPAIGQVYEDAKARFRKKASDEERLRIWYFDFKPRVCSLVGYSRRDNHKLGTSYAYDVVYEIVFNALETGG